VEEAIEDYIRALVERVAESPDGATRYRRPLVAFVSAQHPEFMRLRERISPSHLAPQDLLPEAESVISFFLPFAKSVVVANSKSDYTAREWAVAYIETNRLIDRICCLLGELLADYGYRSRWELPTYNFDPVRLFSRWSHKSVAVVAGLGSFGLHQMVITDAGCAGRFGSLVTSASLTPTPFEYRERCRYFVDRSCHVCIERCPIGALTESGLDRSACYERCLEVDRYYPDLELSDVCGKCATGPCALQT